MLLAGDIGGTKTRLGVFSPSENPRSPLVTATLRSAEFDSLESLCRDFLETAGIEVDMASLGVPGPVVSGRATTTNLPWEVDERRLSSSLGLQGVTLFNDLVAVARAIPELEAEDLQTIVPGHARPGGAVTIVAPGTGLGVAYGFTLPTGYAVLASEGGHSDFAPTSPLQEDLLAFLRVKYGHVSYERLCSGRGLPNIYDYLKVRGHCEEPGWLASRLAVAGDPTPVIVKAALDPARGCRLCEETLRLFVAILGAKAGNEALAVVATGGVYLAGGVPPHILPVLEKGPFAAAFRDKGRMRPLLESVPVHVIRTPDAPLLGAARLGLDAFNP